MDALQQQLIFTESSLLCAGIAAIHDVRERRIPNYTSGAGLAMGLLLHSITGWRGLGDATLAGILAGAVFLVFFFAGGMGAGDVKLMAAVACLAGLAQLCLLMASTAIAGACFAIVVSLGHGRFRETLGNVGAVLTHHRRHGLRPHPDLNLANSNSLRLPFALPIAAGCLFTLCALAWESYP